MFTYARPNSHIPKDHPLRATRRINNATMAMLSLRFGMLYAKEGHPTIAPEMTADVLGDLWVTVAADKAFNTTSFATQVRALNAISPAAQNISAQCEFKINAGTVRNAGYVASRAICKGVEEGNG